jgi:hypothetical protein
MGKSLAQKAQRKILWLFVMLAPKVYYYYCLYYTINLRLNLEPLHDVNLILIFFTC